MKKILILALAALLIGLAVPPAFAALNQDQQKEVDGLWQQMLELRKQMIDRYVDAGDLTKEQGDLMKKNMDVAQEYRAQNGFTPGFGMGGIGGCPMAGGIGAGAGAQGTGYFGGMMGGRWGGAW